MRLFTLLTTALFAMAMAACEKEEEPAPEDTDSPEVVQRQISEDLAKQDNISTFVKAFEALELKEEDIDEGITIFAPTNEALEGAGAGSNARVLQSASDSTELSNEELKDHIVKGVIQAAGLHDGDTLITLNGKQLLVTIDGNEVRINGVLLTEKNVASHAKYAVHTVQKILSNTTPSDSTGFAETIEITVWNGAKWSPDKPKGETEAGVTVSLYNSQTDYALGNEAAFTLQTETGGIATFQDIEAGKAYYVVAKKDNISNLFYVTQTPQGELIGMVPDGIFQSQAEIDTHVEQSDAQPGNFRWTDQNSDGVISEADFAPVPYEAVQGVSDQTVRVDITIGFDNNYTMGYIKTEDAALQLLKSSYERLDSWQKELVLMDGMLSDDAVCEGGTLCEVDGFQINPAHSVISRIWSEGYGTIGRLNHLIRDLPGLSFTGKAEVLAQAKGLRAYIYLQLVTYFGDIPIQTGMAFEEDIERTTSQEVYNLIVTDLTDVAGLLPAQWPSDKKYQLNQDAVRALLAKANLWNQEYQSVAEFTGNILSSGRYQLMESTTPVFETAGNAEIIWDFSIGASSSNLDYFYSNYFFQRTFCPSMRLAEVYLMHAEAKFGLAQTEEGINSLNMIRSQQGMALVDATLSTEELKEALRTTWKEAMPREGNRFGNLVRWEKANEVLGPLGYQPHHAVLPIPQIYIDRYYNLLQNPGY